MPASGHGDRQDYAGGAKVKPSVCFVALNAYDRLSGRKDVAHIGGAERQQVLLARELAARGYRVSFMAPDHGQGEGIQHEGIKIYRAYVPSAGLPCVGCTLWR